MARQVGWALRLGVMLLAGCTAARPEASPLNVAIPAPVVAREDAAAEATLAASQQSAIWTALSKVSEPELFRIDGALLLTALVGDDLEPAHRAIWRVEGSRTVAHSELDVTAKQFGRLEAIRGAWPDDVYALTTGSDGSPWVLLHREPSGWARMLASPSLDSIEWTGTALLNLGRSPGELSPTLSVVAGQGPAPIVPPGQGAQCDAFFAGPHAAWPRLAVLPRALGVVAGHTFVLGMGCHGGLAVAHWDEGATTTQVVPLPVPTVFDAMAGRVIGRRSGEAWYVRDVMRPMLPAVALRLSAGVWQSVALPVADTGIRAADVDPSGSLWAVLEVPSELEDDADLPLVGSLWRWQGDTWARRKLPRDCDAVGIACADDGAVWVACEQSVLRLAARAPR